MTWLVILRNIQRPNIYIEFYFVLFVVVLQVVVMAMAIGNWQFKLHKYVKR